MDLDVWYNDNGKIFVDTNKALEPIQCAKGVYRVDFCIWEHLWKIIIGSEILFRDIIHRLFVNCTLVYLNNKTVHIWYY